MSDFRAKITAELDTSDIKSQIQGINETLPLKVDTTKLRTEIQNALKKEFDIKVKNTDSNKSAKSKLPNNASSVSLSKAQLAQVETARRKSQIRTSEFEKKSNAKVQEAKLKNIDKVETAQKTSDIRVREAQHKQEIKDASWREKQRVAEAKKVQREQEKIRQLTDPNSAHERVYGSTYRNAYDRSLAHGKSVKTAQKAGLSAVKAEKMYQFGDALDDVTRSATRYIALPIAVATAASVKAFMDYETAFTGVRKTVDGTDAELQAVSDGLEEMALRIPVASVELAHIAQLGGQLGIPTKSLLKFTETVAGLETATNLQGEEGASTLARFMNVVNEDFDNVDRVGSAIVDLGNHFATTESEIATMSQRLGATGSIIGMSTSDILGYAAALSATGVKAEAGGSAMSRVWQDISQAVSKGGEGLNAYAKVSKKTAAEFAATWKASPTEAFNDLLEGLKESPDMIKALDDMGINNIRDIRALQNLANRYDIVEKALERANTAYKQNTALSNEANRAYSTTASKLQIAKESIVQAGRSIGETVAPTVIDFAGGIKKAATGFTKLSDGSKKAIVSFSLLTAGTIAGANGLAKLIKTGATLKKGFLTLKTVASPLVTKLLPGLAGKAGLAGVGSSALAAVGGVAAISAAVAGLGVVAKKVGESVYNSTYKWSEGMSETSEKIGEQSQEIIKLNNLRKEVSELELIITNPASSQAEIESAKTRIEEIAALLNKEYNLNITADTPSVESALTTLTAGKRNDMMGTVTTKIQEAETNSGKYKEDKASYSKNKKLLSDTESLYREMQNIQSQLAVLNHDSILDENELIQADRLYSRWAQLHEKTKELGIDKNIFSNDQVKKLEELQNTPFSKETESDYWAAFDMEMDAIKRQYEKLNKTVPDISNSVTEYEDSIKSAADYLMQMLDSDVSLGDKYGSDTDINLLKQLGSQMNDVGMNTDEVSTKVAIAKQGVTDFNTAIQEGKLDAVVNDYIKFKDAIGATAEDSVRGAAVLKQGFSDISQITTESMNNVYSDMKKLGKEKGVKEYIANAIEGTSLFAAGFHTIEEAVASGEEGISKVLSNARQFHMSEGFFDGLNIQEQSAHLTSFARNLGLIPETKSVKIDVDSGEITVLEDKTKAIFDLWDGGERKLAVGVSTEDADKIWNFQEKFKELNGQECQVTFRADGEPVTATIGDVKYQLTEFDNTTGTATLRTEAGEAIGTIDMYSGKIELLPDEKTIKINTESNFATDRFAEYQKFLDGYEGSGDFKFDLTPTGVDVLNTAGETIANIPSSKDISFSINEDNNLEVFDSVNKTITELGKDHTIKYSVQVDVGNTGEIEATSEALKPLDGKTYTSYIDAEGKHAYATIDGINYKLENYDKKTNTATLLANNGQALGVINVTTGELNKIPEKKDITIKATSTGTAGLTQYLDSIDGEKNISFKINTETYGIDVLNSAGQVISELKKDPNIRFLINTEGNLEILNYLTGKTTTLNKDGAITVTVNGEEQVTQLNSEIQQTNDKTVTVTGKTTGLDSVTDLKTRIDIMTGKAILVSAGTNGTPQVLYLKDTIDNTNSKGVIVSGTTTGQPQLSLMQGTINGTNSKGVTLTGRTIGQPALSLAHNTIATTNSKGVSLTVKTYGTPQLSTALGYFKSFHDKSVNVNITTTKTDIVNTIYQTSYKRVGNTGTVLDYGKGPIRDDPNFVDGTAYAQGTAFKSGNWGTKSSGVALGGELGEELVVRNGKFFTIGSNSAEFFSYRKGDIIFNAEQTKQIFEKGKIVHGKKRGRAFADGTTGLAFADGSKEPENFDWIETRGDRFQRAIDIFTSIFENTFLTLSKRFEGFETAISKIMSSLSHHQEAYAKYLEKAESIGLSEEYAVKVRDGSLDISSISDENLQKQINDYKEWYEKALAAEEKIDELATSIQQMFVDKFETLSGTYDSILGQIENKITMLESRISLAEQKGWMTSTRYYQEMINQQDSYIRELKNKQIDLTNSLNDALDRGEIQRYSEAWYSMREEINGVNEAIIDAEVSLSEYNKEMRQVQWDRFDYMQGALSGITDEADFLIDLLGEDLYNSDLGNVNELITSMKKNSSMWHDASEEYRKVLEKENISMAEQIGAIFEQDVFKSGDGTWWLADSLYNADIKGLEAYIKEMKANSEAWHSETDEFRKVLEQDNVDIANYISEVTGKPVSKTAGGKWLIGDREMYSYNPGDLNDKGMAVMGLHGVKYNAYMEQALSYAKELERVNADMVNNPHDTNLIARKNELLELQRESILSAKAEKEAILDLVNEGIEVELDSLKELIDSYTESLDSAKSLYEYQQKVANSTKDIAALEKQLAAYANDNSEETKATIQKLKVELEEAQQDLKDTEYDKYIDDQKELLDAFYTDYEEIINKRLDNIDVLIEDAIDTINVNAKDINKVLTKVTQDVGANLSNEMSQIWTAEDAALNKYLNTNGSVIGGLALKANGYFDVTSGEISGMNTSLTSIVSDVNKLVMFASVVAHATTDPSTVKDQMKQNSIDWWTTTDKDEQDLLSLTNKQYANEMGYTQENGTWYDSNGKAVYEVSVANKIDAMIKEMKANSEAWFSATESERKELAKANEILADRIYDLSGNVTWKDKNGVWWIEDEELYSYNPYSPKLLKGKNSNLLSEYDFSLQNTFKGFDIDLNSILENLPVPATNNISPSIGDINIDVQIDHVDDYNDFVSKLQKDSQIAKLIRSESVDLISGDSELAKNKYKW